MSRRGVGWETMKQALASVVEDICRRYGSDRARMMDIVLAVQQRLGCVSTEAMEIIAREVNSHRVEVESVVTFYAFLSVKSQGKVIIRLCNDIVDWMKGYEAVADAMAKELGVTMGETTADGAITLTHTPCIGMSDQAPAALLIGMGVIEDFLGPDLTAEQGAEPDRGLDRKTEPLEQGVLPGHFLDGTDVQMDRQRSFQGQAQADRLAMQ